MRITLSAILLPLIILTGLAISPAAARDITTDFVREEFPPVIVYRETKDSLVSIESVSLPYAGVSLLNTFQRTIARVGGTGFLVTEDGYILVEEDPPKLIPTELEPHAEYSHLAYPRAR